MKTVNPLEAKCNNCDNKTCSQGELHVKKTKSGKCFAFKPYAQRGFSFLELAISKSATSVNNLLENAGLEFIPNDTDRGFDLEKIQGAYGLGWKTRRSRETGFFSTKHEASKSRRKDAQKTKGYSAEGKKNDQRSNKEFN